MHADPTKPPRRPKGPRILSTVVLMFLSACLCGAPAEAADFSCAGGDVPCLIAAIHQANANGQENTIRLAAGVYTLMAVDNDTDGPNGLPSVSSTLTIEGADADLTSLERGANAPLFRIVHVASDGRLQLRCGTVRRRRSRGCDLKWPALDPCRYLLARVSDDR